MAIRNLNRILATVMISSTAVSLTPMPTFANITHPAACSESMNFDGHLKIHTMCSSAYSSTRYDRTQKADQAQDLENSENKIPWKWLLFSECPRLPRSKSFLDSPKTNPEWGIFPIDDKGEVKQEVKNNYTKVDDKKSPDIRYKDIKTGSGYKIEDGRLLKVSVHYDEYGKSEKFIKGNRSSTPTTRNPEVLRLCTNEELERGMRGMQVGGIRRIIVLPEKKQGRRVLEVELLQVCPSRKCLYAYCLEKLRQSR